MLSGKQAYHHSSSLQKMCVCFWTNPPTWGICRNDLLRRVEIGDYVFFVLPKIAKHRQMIFGYLRVAEVISHSDAHRRRNPRSKRMANKNPNGNIIVDEQGEYNRLDVGAHRHVFQKVKQRYIVGSPRASRFLTGQEIERLAPSFVHTLSRILGRSGNTAIELVSRYGCELSEAQVKDLLRWIKRGAARTGTAR